jgi:hypothetical protein
MGQHASTSCSRVSSLLLLKIELLSRISPETLPESLTHTTSNQLSNDRSVRTRSPVDRSGIAGP